MIGKAEDRISNLPDSLLHHILSFLPTKLVARTSVLSRRWKFIWTSIPILRFGYNKDSSDPISPTFIDYVDGTLHRRCLANNDIHKFLLRSSHHLNDSRLNTWISIVMSRNVKDFGLVLEQNDPSCIPQSFFTCESLTSLQLRVLGDIEFPEYVSFPRLKHLRLEGIKFSNDCWNEKLFSNCPILEDLALLLCRFCTSSFCISIPTLKTLKIIAMHGIHDCTLKIHAPSLLTLNYWGNVAKEYVFSSFDTLVEAVVHTSSSRLEKTCHIEALRQFLRSLAHVKCLTIKNLPPEAKNLLKNAPAYHNIKRLKITQVAKSDVGAVVALLKVMPNLESFVFENEPNWIDNESEENHDNEDDGWTSLDMVGCLFLHLKSVCFKPDIWSPMEISCVKAILRNAKALQSLTIYHGFNSRRLKVTKEEILVQIESFPRASASCAFKNLSWSRSVRYP